MSRSASEGRARGAQAGFTLAETLIALVAGVILGVGVVRFYKDSYHAYSIQDQMQERDQNAHFTVTRFMEIFQQAGAGLPDTGWTILTQANGITTLAVNPRNVVQFNGVDQGASQFLPVNDASAYLDVGNVFLNFRYVLIDFADPAQPIRKYAIDRAYASNGFVAGVKDNATGLDSIRLTAPVKLSVGDRLYGYREDQYLLSGTDLVVRPDGDANAQMVLAENIDSLALVFRDDKGAPTASWKLMRSLHIAVRARTAQPDPRLAGGYRKLTVPMDVILRNRL